MKHGVGSLVVQDGFWTKKYGVVLPTTLWGTRLVFGINDRRDGLVNIERSYASVDGMTTLIRSPS